MTTAAQLRDYILEMEIPIAYTHLLKYSKHDMKTLINGFQDPDSRIGQEVRRNTNEPSYQGSGIIINIVGQRAQVQWDENKTWYAINKLIPV
jgi:hypothetical protein